MCFYCSWLDDGQDDGKIERTIEVERELNLNLIILFKLTKSVCAVLTMEFGKVFFSSFR